MMFAFSLSNGWLYVFQLVYFNTNLGFKTIATIYLFFPLIFSGLAILQPAKPLVSREEGERGRKGRREEGGKREEGGHFFSWFILIPIWVLRPSLLFIYFFPLNRDEGGRRGRAREGRVRTS
jgi:hypothetical protein